MVGWVTPNSAAIWATVHAPAVEAGFLVHVSGDSGLACGELGLLAAGAGGGEAVKGALGHEGASAPGHLPSTPPRWARSASPSPPTITGF
jgi:hypothetical protein